MTIEVRLLDPVVPPDPERLRAPQSFPGVPSDPGDPLPPKEVPVDMPQPVDSTPQKVAARRSGLADG